MKDYKHREETQNVRGVRLGLPITRLAKSFNRQRILAASFTDWRGFPVASARSAGFIQLILVQ
jgi:hypothetical protein